MRKPDHLDVRARELCVAAGIDPESRVGEGRGMPAWCTFRDAARREQMLKDASEAELSMQAPEYRNPPAESVRQARRRHAGANAQLHGVGNVVAGVICADGHLGYAQPVGGVIAYERQISISGVGFDIGCGNMAVRLDTPYAGDRRTASAPIIRDVARTISFGIGRTNEERAEHALFDDADAWRDIRHGGLPPEGGGAARHRRLGQPLCRPDARRGRLRLDRRAFRQPRPRPHQRDPLSQGRRRQGRHERAARGDRRGRASSAAATSRRWSWPAAMPMRAASG